MQEAILKLNSIKVGHLLQRLHQAPQMMAATHGKFLQAYLQVHHIKLK